MTGYLTRSGNAGFPVLPRERAYRLSAYDAAYLELAMRHRAPLVTLDLKLQKAARKAGIQAAAGKAV